jgi:hypothetical protein
VDFIQSICRSEHFDIACCCARSATANVDLHTKLDTINEQRADTNE